MLVIGHRGAPRACPENTPASFEAADRMGADGVELDVWPDLHGPGRLELIVHHDALPTDPTERAALPRLDDVLDACGDRMLVNVELKNEPPHADPTMAVVAPVVDALRRRGPSWTERILVSSFSLPTIDHCRVVGPEFATAFLIDRRDDPADAIEHAARHGHRALHPDHRGLDAEVVAAAHARGLAVNSWTANEPDRIAELAAMGVDGVCTDVPDRALDAIGRGADPPAVRPRWASLS